MKMYVTFPGPINERVMGSLKSEVKKQCGLEITPHVLEHEEMEICVFEVDKESELAVVEAIHSMGDFQCAFAVPRFENGEWYNFYE